MKKGFKDVGECKEGEREKNEEWSEKKWKSE